MRQNCVVKREQGSDSNMADRLVFRPNYKINLDSFKEQEPQQAAKLYLTFGEGKGKELETKYEYDHNLSNQSTVPKKSLSN